MKKCTVIGGGAMGRQIALNTAIHGYEVVGLGVVVSTLRLKQVITLLDIATIAEVANVIGSVEGTVIGVHHSITIHNLHQVGVERGGAIIAVILRTVAIGIGLVLVDEHIAEALETRIGVTHSAICQYHSAIVVRCEVTNEDEYRRVALIDKITVVGNHIDHTSVATFTCLGHSKECVTIDDMSIVTSTCCIE